MYSVNIKLNSTNGGSGPFNIFAYNGGNTITLKVGVPASTLTSSAGLDIFNIPDAYPGLRVTSNNVLCKTTQDLDF